MLPSDGRDKKNGKNEKREVFICMSWILEKENGGKRKKKNPDGAGEGGQIKARQESGKRLIVVVKGWADRAKKGGLKKGEGQTVGGKKIDGEIREDQYEKTVSD